MPRQMNRPRPALASRLRHYRLIADITQPDLAAKAGIPPGSYSAMELGTMKPDLEQGAAIAKVLKVDLETLAGAEKREVTEAEQEESDKIAVLVGIFKRLDTKDKNRLLGLAASFDNDEKG